jgi:hypothetical protein
MWLPGGTEGSTMLAISLWLAIAATFTHLRQFAAGDRCNSLTLLTGMASGTKL